MSIWTNVKQALTRFIPSHVNDPFGLIRRMLTSGKKAAPFTLWLTGLSILATPIDWVMQRFENRTRENVKQQSSGPHIIICGPARSGTTLMYQVLADQLNVAYVRNFTMAFSRSPVLASRLFTRQSARAQKPDYENYYGKTAGMQAPCEANHLWNQWVDVDASAFRTKMSQDGAARMADFFNSFSASEAKPTISKNNNANAFATQIAQSLNHAYFICLKRETRFLAQSLLQARMEINGDIEQSYGVTNTTTLTKSQTAAQTTSQATSQVTSPATKDLTENDPVEQVLEQIDYLNNLAQAQQSALGEDRFWIVDYEDFCNDPAALVERVKVEILKDNTTDNTAPIKKIAHNNRCTNPALFEKIEHALLRKKNNN